MFKIRISLIFRAIRAKNNDVKNQNIYVSINQNLNKGNINPVQSSTFSFSIRNGKIIILYIEIPTSGRKKSRGINNKISFNEVFLHRFNSLMKTIILNLQLLQVCPHFNLLNFTGSISIIPIFATIPLLYLCGSKQNL